MCKFRCIFIEIQKTTIENSFCFQFEVAGVGIFGLQTRYNHKLCIGRMRCEKAASSTIEQYSWEAASNW